MKKDEACKKYMGDRSIAIENAITCMENSIGKKYRVRQGY